MPKTLLLADDSVVIQKLVGLSFANEDVELITTDNGDDALAKAREHKPDAILADVVMPGMNGYEVCEAVKSDAELQGTPVLLLTGTFEAFDESRASDVGSDGHITKPFEAQALVDRVNALFAAPRPAAEPQAAATDAAVGTDDTYDFFDDGVEDLSSSPGTDITRTGSPLATGPAAPAASPGFDLGGGPTAPDPFVDDDLLGQPVDLDQALEDPGPDQTIVVTGDDPLADPFADPMGAAPAATDPMASVVPPAASQTPVDDTFLVDSPPSVPDTHTTVIMSNGDSSSARIALGADAQLPATPAPGETMLADDLFDASAAPVATPSPWSASPAESNPILPTPTPTADAPSTDLDLDSRIASDMDAPANTGADSGIASAADSSADSEIGPDIDADIASIPPVLGVSSIDASSDAFDFGVTDPGDEAPAIDASVDSGSENAFAPPLADDYDVSSSDLGDPFAITPQPVADLDRAVPEADEPAGMSLSNGLLGSPMAMQSEDSELEVASDADSADDAVVEAIPAIPMPMTDSAPSSETPMPAPDITPVMRDRIHETLERVAWEAFADLSETMVKQVLERVEAVAWEVIPQMAEALIKEEIRRMKGDDED